MPGIKDLRIPTKLALLVVTTALGFVFFGYVGNSTLNTVKVKGPIYESIILGKNLDEDVVPPPLYLSEAQIKLLALMSEKDPRAYQTRIDAFHEDERAFREAHEKYNRDLPDGKIKDLVNGKSYSEAVAWLDIVNNELLPAKLHKDEKAVLRIYEQEAQPHFLRHRDASIALAKAVEEDTARQEDQASATVRSRTTVLLAVGFGIGALIVVFGWFTSRLITNSLKQMVEVLQTAATGDLRARVTVNSKDESGIMGQALNHTLERISQAIRCITESAVQLAGSSEEFSANSQQITANSEETSAQASVVAAATEQVNYNLQTVATSTEEMATSVKDIARNASEAARVADEAMKTATDTNATVAKLGASSAEIGQVIKVITSIAQKTDLLALNATVEAARAGEVGAGFAVVANEVKELAKQTASATEEISRKIEAIQADAKAAVTAIGSISGVIARVNEISMSIATAVEEQSATTMEMARNVTEAARGSSEVAHNISGVAQAAQDTSSSAGQSLIAAHDLAKLSRQLRRLVEQFKVEPSAAHSKPVPRGVSAPKEAGERVGHVIEEETLFR